MGQSQAASITSGRPVSPMSDIMGVTSLRVSLSFMPLMRVMTPQQLKVLSMISQGLPNKQIAYELQVSEPTVKAHVTAILRKLGVNSRTQAVTAARLIDLRPDQ